MRPQTIDNVQRENLSSQKKRKLLSQGHTMCLDSISPHANSTCLVLNTNIAMAASASTTLTQGSEKSYNRHGKLIFKLFK